MHYERRICIKSRNLGTEALQLAEKEQPTVINTMRMKGTLEQYLTDIDRNAREMFDRMTKEFAEFEGITEQLKADDQMEWVGRMYNIRMRVTHAVNCELIYA